MKITEARLREIIKEEVTAFSKGLLGRKQTPLKNYVEVFEGPQNTAIGYAQGVKDKKFYVVQRADAGEWKLLSTPLGNSEDAMNQIKAKYGRQPDYKTPVQEGK
jgi:hypothetical protein